MLGATGSFCCRLNRCRVVATTIADGARAMATIAARVLQASIDSPTSAGAFLHVAAASSLLTSATPYGRICGLSVLHRSRVDHRERGSQLEQPSMGCGVHGRSSSSKADEGRARVGALRICGRNVRKHRARRAAVPVGKILLPRAFVACAARDCTTPWVQHPGRSEVPLPPRGGSVARAANRESQPGADL